MSAFWHGFYPGYYLGFTYFHFCIEVQKTVYKNQEKLLGKEGSVLRKIKEWALE